MGYSEKFKSLVKEIFDHLKSTHPIPVQVNSLNFSVADIKGDYIKETLNWLVDEGYLRNKHPNGGWVLTEKAFRMMGDEILP